MRRALLLGVLCSTVATSPLWAQTDTPTDTPTATTSPTQTPTPTATCAGTRVSFPLTSSIYDGYTEGRRVIYAPTSCQSVNTTSDMQVARSKVAFNRYDTDVAIICFPTNTLGPGATVLEAKVHLETGMFGNADHRNLVGEWLPNGFPISCADWASVSSDTAFSLPVDSLHIVKDLIDPALTNAATNVNRFGNTCLRIHIDGSLPTGINRVDLGSFDVHGGGSVNPTLDVCITTGPTPTGVQSTSTPTNTPTPLWINHYGSSSADIGYAVATTDGAGNPFLGGFYGGPMIFGNPTPLTTSGQDAFIAKFDPAGNIQWIQHTGNTGSNAVLALATDSAGNVYGTGRFQNTIQWPGCAAMTEVGDPSTSDIFTVKLAAADGTCQWSHSYGSGNDDFGYGIAVDSTGAVLVTGVFIGHTSFGGTALFSSNSASGPSTFIAKYTSGGVHIWSTAFSQAFAINGPDEGRAIATDSSNNVYVTGYFQGTEYFDNINPTTSVGLSRDVYVVKFSSAGAFVRRDVYGDVGSDIGLGISVDGADNIALAGQFAGSVDFGGGALTASGPLAGVLASYTSSGTWRWSRALTSSSVVAANTVVADKVTNEVITAGQFQGGVNFGGGTLTSGGADDIFVSKYFADGTYENAVKYGGTLADVSYAVALDPIHNIYITGYFQGTVNFGGLGPITSNGSADIFLLKLDPPLDALVFTPTPTPMPTNTPTASGSPTLTHTPMPTNTPTISPTPSNTPSPTRTSTRTPTPNIHRLLIQLKRIQVIPF